MKAVVVNPESTGGEIIPKQRTPSGLKQAKLLSKLNTVVSTYTDLHVATW